MIFGIPATPFNFINAVVLIISAWVVLNRHSKAFGSNLPVVYWGAILAHAKFFEGGYDIRWVLAGMVCCLLLRFEFMNDLLVKFVQAGEFAAMGYVIWRTVGLILMW